MKTKPDCADELTWRWFLEYLSESDVSYGDHPDDWMPAWEVFEAGWKAALEAQR